MSGHESKRDANNLAALRPEIAAQWDKVKNGSVTPEEVCRNIVTRQEVCDKIREMRITEGMNGYGRKNQNDVSITQ